MFLGKPLEQKKVRVFGIAYVNLYINIFQFMSRLIKEVILSFLSVVQDQDVKLVNSLMCS